MRKPTPLEALALIATAPFWIAVAAVAVPLYLGLRAWKYLDEVLP